MAVLQQRGREALAGKVAATPIFLAWGRGNPAWDAVPEPEPSDATALVDEIGRRQVTTVAYVRPDAAGEIELADESRWAIHPSRTSYVLVRTVFAYAEAAGQTVRELGFFLDCQPVAGLPAGQRYFTPAQIAVPGDLYTLQRVQKFVRDGSVRQSFEFVLPF